MRWRRSSIARELRELEQRKAILLEQLELVNLRDATAAGIIAGFAANSNPDQGVTRVEVLRAYELAQQMIEDSDRGASDPSFSDLHTGD
jgi:hypothetical protein